MSRYELYLFIHIAAAVIWVGGGFMFIVLGLHAENSGEERRLLAVFEQIGAVAERVMIPASLVVVLVGILMIVDGPWSFDQLWLVLGLVGFFATFLIGLLILAPKSKALREQLAQEGLSPATVVGIRRWLTIARADSVVLFVIIADMTIKPTGDDVGVLLVMALATAAGVAYIVTALRALDAEAAAPAAA